MSRFYASIKGRRGAATRTGTANSGLDGHVRGWDVGVRVVARDYRSSDVFDVYMTHGSNGGGADVKIGTVKIGPFGRPKFYPEFDPLPGENGERTTLIVTSHLAPPPLP